jgi:hypothetical protein
MIIAVGLVIVVVSNAFSFEMGFKDGQQRPHDTSFFYSEAK